MMDIDLRKTMLVILLWLVGLGAAAQFAKFVVPFELLRQEYPDNDILVGWMLTLISGLGAAFGMTASVFVVKAGLARTLVGALILGALMSFWQSTLPAPLIMLTTRLVEGMSHLIIVIAAPTLIAQICTDRFRGIGMTLWSTFFGVSFALTAWFGLPFAQLNGLSNLIMVHGSLMLILAIAVWLMLPKDDISARSHVNGADKALENERITIKLIINRHIQAYSSNAISAPAIGWLFYTLTFVSLLAILPDLIDADIRSFVVGIMPLVSIAVSLVIVSTLIIYISSATAIAIGFAGGAIVCLSYFISMPVEYLAIALFAVLGLVQGASFSLVPELNKSTQDRALANGAMAQMGNVGNLLGTPVLLFIISFGGTDLVFASVAMIYGLGAIIHLVLARKRDLQNHPV